MHNGRIVEQGSHEELIALNGEYKMLYQQQFLRYQEWEILRKAAPQPGNQRLALGEMGDGAK